MEEEIVKTAVGLAGAYGPLAAIIAIVVGAILLVLYRRAKKVIPDLHITVTGEQDADPDRPGPIVPNVGPNGELPTGEIDPSGGSG